MDIVFVVGLMKMINGEGCFLEVSLSFFLCHFTHFGQKNKLFGAQLSYLKPRCLMGWWFLHFIIKIFLFSKRTITLAGVRFK